MKHLRKFLTTLLLFCTTVVAAHHFEVDGIYYNILSEEDKTVEVTFKGNSSNYYSNEYTGNVAIPETVIYNKITYKVARIGSHAFSDCSTMTNVIIPNGTVSIAEGAFINCTGLTDVVIPNTVTAIGTVGWNSSAYGAFEGCSNLTSIEIPNSVTTIGEDAFSGCTKLESIEIPSSVVMVGGGAFNNTLWFEQQPEGLVYIGDVLYRYKGKIPVNAEINIKDGTKAIAEYAFVENVDVSSELLDVIIPNSVTHIARCAFWYCSKLTKIIIPKNVVFIGNQAFDGCDNLATVVNQSSLTFEKGSRDYGYIAYYANKVVNNAVVIDDFVFDNDKKQLSCYIGKNKEITLPADFNGEKYSIGESAFSSSDELKKVIIGNGVTAIGESAFFGCTGLESVTIGNSVTSIGTKAFCYCFDLTSVTIGNSVTSIGHSAFSSCLGLTSITIPNSVTSIGEFAFSFSGLVEVELGNGINSLEMGTFASCRNLTTITIPDCVTRLGASDLNDSREGVFCDCSNLANIEIPKSVTIIGALTFCGCTNLKYIEIPNSVTSIGTYAFYGCSGLESVTIPNSVTTIGSSAFHGCSGLTNVTIPNSVTSIGYYAFSGCSGLTSVVSMISAENLFAVYTDTFENVDKNICTLYVPYGAKETYAATSGWNVFANIVELDPTEVAITINEYGSATYCSPFALDFSNVEGLKAYAATGYNTATQVVTLTRIMTAKETTGLFLMGAPGEYIVPVLEYSNDFTLNLLVGTLEPTGVNGTTDDGNYINFKYTIGETSEAPLFYQFEDNSTLSAGKAYLQLPASLFLASASKSVSVRFDDGTTTDIEEVVGSEGEAQTVYDLQGRKVENPVKGIYIINGKKVLVR